CPRSGPASRPTASTRSASGSSGSARVMPSWIACGARRACDACLAGASSLFVFPLWFTLRAYRSVTGSRPCSSGSPRTMARSCSAPAGSGPRLSSSATSSSACAAARRSGSRTSGATTSASVRNACARRWSTAAERAPSDSGAHRRRLLDQNGYGLYRGRWGVALTRGRSESPLDAQDGQHGQDAQRLEAALSIEAVEQRIAPVERVQHADVRRDLHRGIAQLGDPRVRDLRVDPQVRIVGSLREAAAIPPLHPRERDRELVRGGERRLRRRDVRNGRVRQTRAVAEADLELAARPDRPGQPRAHELAAAGRARQRVTAGPGPDPRHRVPEPALDTAAAAPHPEVDAGRVALGIGSFPIRRPGGRHRARYSLEPLDETLDAHPDALAHVVVHAEN